jgi:hypothetical protein
MISGGDDSPPAHIVNHERISGTPQALDHKSQQCFAPSRSHTEFAATDVPGGFLQGANQARGGAPPDPPCPFVPQGNERAHSLHSPSLNSESGAKENRFHVTYAFNRLGETIADTLHQGGHVLVDGQLVSSNYERENGKSKKGKAAKLAIFWNVRANSIRQLSRAEAEVPVQASAPEPASDDAPF